MSEDNDDWWTGRGALSSQAWRDVINLEWYPVNGKQALFPSSYVEKIAIQQRSVPPISNRSYKPFAAAQHGVDLPPATGESVNSVGLQEAPGQAEKKNSLNKYKSTLAHSAVGGVGFGAGPWMNKTFTLISPV